MRATKYVLIARSTHVLGSASLLLQLILRRLPEMVPVMRPPLKTPQLVLSVLGVSKVPVALTPFSLTSETCADTQIAITKVA